MPQVLYRLAGKLVAYEAAVGSWRFITLPKAASAELRAMFHGTRAWGSLPCTVTIGGTTWQTSVFWSKQAGYMLPVKAAVRKAEGLADGDPVAYTLDIQV